jgi:hypothetical protein
VLFAGNAGDLECFFGQPAQLAGVSAAGLGLPQDIVGVEEQKGFQGSRVQFRSGHECQEHGGEETQQAESGEAAGIKWAGEGLISVLFHGRVFSVEGFVAIW